MNTPTARPQDVALLPLAGTELSAHVYKYAANPGTDAKLRDLVEAYARACVTAALASAQAREDELRAEVDEWKRVATAQAELHDEAEARAERLEEALRGMVRASYAVCMSIDPRGHRWCEAYLDEALPAAQAALTPNAAQPGETGNG